MSGIDQARQQLLESFLSGELDLHSERGRQVLASDAELAARLRRLQDLQRRLDEAGAAERRGLAAARETAVDPLVEQRVESLVTRHLARGDRAGSDRAGSEPTGSDPTGSAPPPRPWPGLRGRWMVAAACLVLALGLVAIAVGSGLGPAEDDSILGPGAAVHVALHGGTEAGFADLRWVANLPVGGWFEAIVYDADPTRGGVELARSRELEAPRWRPDSDHSDDETDHRRWPATVWIEIIRGDPRGSAIVCSEPVSRSD